MDKQNIADFPVFKYNVVTDTNVIIICLNISMPRGVVKNNHDLTLTARLI